MSTEIVKHIEFGVVRKPLNNWRAKAVLELICACIEQKRVLDDYVLQDWWLERFVKPRNRTISGKYLGKDENGHSVFEKINEYKYRVRQINEHGGLLPGYYWTEAKYALKYHIGNLVVNGYLVALPVIKLSPTPEEINNIEHE